MEVELPPMKPMSLLQRLILRRGGTAVTYPERCGICGSKTQGNIFIGFWDACHHHYDED